MNELRPSKTLLIVCGFMIVGLARDPSSVQDLPSGSPGSTGTGTPGPVAAADSSDSPPFVSEKLVGAADQAPAAPEAPAEKEQSAVINASDGDTNEYSERTIGTEEFEAIDANEPTLEEWTEYLESVGYFDNPDSGARGGCACNFGGDCCGGFCVCDPGCSATFCSPICNPGNAICLTQCGGDPCNITCDPCGAGCGNECSLDLCPENHCTATCTPEPECDILCGGDPCDSGCQDGNPHVA